MLAFAVVVSRSGGPIPDGVLDRLRDRACDDVPFDAHEHLLWSNDAGTVWFGGWQNVADDDAAARHWHVDEDGLTAFAGDVWPRRDGWRGSRPWAEQLAGHLRSTPLTPGGDDLAGVFVAASLHRAGRGSVAADPLGVGLIYWGQGRDIIVISSRAAVAAGLLAAEDSVAPKRDATGVGWLAYSVHPMGLRTGFEEISVAPQGALIAIDPKGGARLSRGSRPPWRSDAEDTTSPEDMLEEVRIELGTATRMAFSSPGEKRCAGLTGGKDSRLILALLLADGLAGDVEFQTFGEADLPDVIVARQIAQSLGLRHVENPDRPRLWAWRQAVEAAVRDAGHAEISSREIGQRITAWACSGVRNVAKAHLGRLPPGDRVLLSGFFGETLRTNYPGSTRFRTKAEVANLPTQQRFGAASILRPDALALYQREIHKLLFDGCLETDSPQDVVDAFYIRNRIRRWFGTEHEIESDSRVFPLYSITGVRLAFGIGAENRHAEWIHYQLMRQAYEPLVHMAFADTEWCPGADCELAAPQWHNEPAPVCPPTLKSPGAQPFRSLQRLLRRTPDRRSTRTAPEERRAKGEMLDVDIMRRYLSDRSNPVFEVVDPGATQRALEQFATLAVPQKLQLYGALSAAIWLGEHEIALPREVAFGVPG